MLGKRLLVLVALAASAVMLAGFGCLSNANQQRDPDSTVCRKVTPTGSHIPRTACWKVRHADERGEEDRSKMRDMQIGSGMRRAGPDPAPSGPGR